MSGAELGLGLAVFGACAVEAVEALTIVLAVGITRSWSSTLAGVTAASLALAALVAALGPALTAVPIDTLRLLVGGLLLIFGLQWLRKAIMRRAGLKAERDERDAYERGIAAARAAGRRPRSFDGYSFTIALKGVMLEGLEVVFIVLALGASQHRVALAAAAAGLAVLVVTAAGIAVHAPLARVPENTIKLAVGVMLSSYGIFWGAEGAGARWPGGDATLLAIVPLMLLVALVLASAPVTARLSAGARTGSARPRASTPGDSPRTDRRTRTRPRPEIGYSSKTIRRVATGARGVWEFIVGDDWQTALAVVLALAATALLAAAQAPSWWVLPAAVPLTLGRSIGRAADGPAGVPGVRDQALRSAVPTAR